MKLDHSLLMERAARIRLLVLDVDGVLTDGSIIYDSSGSQVQAFHVHDGLGLKLIDMAGINIAIISSRTSAPLEKRARELGIKFVVQGSRNKTAAYEEIRTELNITPDETAYIGDDWVDIPMLKRVGLAVVVANSTDPMKNHAHYVTEKPGGQGAVREVCDLLLKATGKWGELFNHYLSS